MTHPDHFDVIVVGGGHAGTEAALAAARLGCETALLTHDVEDLGQMSCNPAIGGIGKSQLVREVDALGGAMAHATDRGGIQFRVLNERKGPAVRATRAQADRRLYQAAIRDIVSNQPGLTVIAQPVDDLFLDGERVTGVVTRSGTRLHGGAVVLTTGTFLGGRIHIGLESHAAGRAGAPPAIALAKRLRALPLRVGRLKTGTPPRLDRSSVDTSAMTEQPGLDPAPVMSFIGSRSEHPRQVSCFITRTNERTHEEIRAGLARSPLFTGAIEGEGPRYCPSIEDKIVRFEGRPSHLVFVEPEGLDSTEFYPNGISTSLPLDVQVKMVRSIRGFERARITRPGYAIEYDYLDPRDLLHSLESRVLDGLFLAGQINGTTGYEEAAAQGVLAGLNAARKVGGQEPWWPRRDEAYLGVLVDDLVSLGASEPYRMFTSRAEHRLRLREDNADRRLTPRGRELGLVSDERWSAYTAHSNAIDEERRRLTSLRIRPGSEACGWFEERIGRRLRREESAFELLRRPEFRYQDVAARFGGVDDPGVVEQIETDARYEVYIQRQHREHSRIRLFEDTPLPADFDYDAIVGLGNEVRGKWKRARPATLAVAARIPGATPAAVSLLLVHLKRSGATPVAS